MVCIWVYLVYHLFGCVCASALFLHSWCSISSPFSLPSPEQAAIRVIWCCYLSHNWPKRYKSDVVPFFIFLFSYVIVLIFRTRFRFIFFSLFIRLFVDEMVGLVVCAHSIVWTIFSGHLNSGGLFVCGQGEWGLKRTKEIDKIKIKRWSCGRQILEALKLCYWIRTRYICCHYRQQQQQQKTNK